MFITFAHFLNKTIIMLILDNFSNVYQFKYHNIIIQEYIQFLINQNLKYYLDLSIKDFKQI